MKLEQMNPLQPLSADACVLWCVLAIYWAAMWATIACVCVNAPLRGFFQIWRAGFLWSYVASVAALSFMQVLAHF